VSWPDPITLLPLLAHLSTIGELYPAELDRAAQPWLSLLAKAGWVSPLADGAYAATDAYLSLPTDLSATERLRRICFAIPNYRRYLIAVLAEGLVGAGQVDYYKQLEQWVIGDLSALAGEINTVLDELEAGQGRMVEWPSDRVTARFADWHAGHNSFAEWDQTLLGLSGTPTQLFTKALSYAAFFALPCQGSVLDGKPVALLPDFDLPLDETGHLALPAPVAWATTRQSVNSSLPFYDAQGRPTHDAAQPVPVIWQDALSEQPYYRAVLRVAVAVRLSGYAPDELALFVPDDLGDTRIVVRGRERGALADLLPHLVETLGYRALSKPSQAQVRRILENWCLVGALEARGGQISLRESYARTLHERRRASRFLRGSAREEQRRIERFLKETG